MTTATKYKTYPQHKPSGIDWLGDIPERWEVRRLKHITQFKYGEALKDEDRNSDGDFDVYGSNGIIGKHNLAITKNKTIVVGRKGSYGKITWVKQNCFPVDTTFYIDETATSNNLRWIYYLLLCIKLDEGSQDSAVPGLSREKAYNIFTPFLSIKAQHAIANFLDRKTAKIDEMVAKKQKLIELLKEKRQALITHAVTKGLDPKAKMKPSGIDWLGDIPEGWEIKRLRYVLNLVGGNGFPEDLQGRLEGEYPFYKVSDINGEQLYLETSNNYVEHADIVKNNWKIVPKGSIVTAKIGAALSLNHRKITKSDALIDNNMLGLSLKSDGFDSMYIFYMFKIIDLDWFVNPGAVPSVNISQFIDTFLPMPEAKEQRMIADFLDRETAKIDEMMKKVEMQIEKFQEYRQALITSAVTGKIMVN